MTHLNAPVWKTAVFASALVLASHAAIADKPAENESNIRPVDTPSLLQDTQFRVEDIMKGILPEGTPLQSEFVRNIWAAIAVAGILYGALVWRRKKKESEELQKRILEIKNRNLITKTKEAASKIKHERTKVEEAKKTLTLLQSAREREGFKFWAIQIPDTYEGDNPEEMLSVLEKTSRFIKEKTAELNGMVAFYSSITDLEIEISKLFDRENDAFWKISDEHRNIYGSKKSDQWARTGDQVRKFLSAFRVAYADKQIDTLRQLSEQKEALCSSMSGFAYSIALDISWYKEVPDRIAENRKSLERLPINDEVRMLRQHLNSIDQMYTQKSDPQKIRAQIEKFDETYESIKTTMPSNLSSLDRENYDQEYSGFPNTEPFEAKW